MILHFTPFQIIDVVEARTVIPLRFSISIESVMVSPLSTQPYFAGFYGQNDNYDKATPAYTVTAESSLFTTAINGSELNVVAGQNAGFGYVNVTVDDGETQWTQRFGVAVSSAATGVQTINHTPQYKDPTFYDLQGRRLSELKKGGVYIQNGRKIVVK